MNSAVDIYSFEVKGILGRKQDLSAYKGQVLLVVNTASKCGFTPQYGGLEELYKNHKDKGFSVLGFPSNQFAAQEPGSDEEIAAFCDLTYGVTFPMFGKVDVNGASAHPLFKHLKSQAKGALGTEAIKWNFTKFLVDKNGNVIKRYGSTTKPKEIEKDILGLLG